MNETSEEWQDDVVMKDAPEPTVEMTAKQGGARGASTEQGGETPAQLEKVRDILFGSQARSFGRKLERLEERIASEAAQTREEFRARMGEMESFFKDSLASLTDGLRTEERKRSQAIAEVVAEMQNLARTFDLRADEMEEQFAQRERQLGQQLTQSARELDTGLRDLTRRFERETKGLRDDKTDRATLASMLNDIATRLQRAPAGGSE